MTGYDLCTGSGTPIGHGLINALLTSDVIAQVPPFVITGLARQGNDILLTWKTAGGKTNVVQVSPGGAGGGYSNNFVNLSAPIGVIGSGSTSTNYLDVGGATNAPARYYRVKLVIPPAADDASDPAYSGGWINGSNGGTGFGPWTLKATGVIGSSTNGCFIGSSINNAGGTPPGIDVGGKSWGIYANSGNYTAAYRTFTNGPLMLGQSLLINMDNGYIDSGQSVGLVLRDNNASGSANDYNVGARFEFLYIGFDTTKSYKVVDAGGLQNIGIPFTGTGLRLVFTLTGVNTYTLLVINNVTSVTNTVSGTLNGAGPINSIALYNRNAGSGSDHDAYFNSLQIVGP